jgi:hypothetical protein
MGSALAQARSDTIRGLFTQGFGIGEVSKAPPNRFPRDCVNGSAPMASRACSAVRTAAAP